MRAGVAFRDGLRRVNGAASMIAGLFALTLVVGVPLSFVMREMIAAHLGPSQTADSVASGVNYEWWQEFAQQAGGLGKTFVPSLAGFGAVLDNLQGIADNLPLASSLVAITGGWLLVWSFLSGGVLDRLARGRKTRSHGFFAACGMHVWRLLRLGAIAWAAYGFLFTWLHPWLFASVVGRLSQDVTSERSAFALRAAAYVIFGGLLIALNILFDYARVRLVVEDRRSAVGALVAAWRFLRRHGPTALGLYALNALAFLLLVALYAAVAPGAPRSGWLALAALGIGEAYILGRLYLKLLFYASETALFQGELAHAAYTAAPAVVWPDSPAAESIANADRTAS